LQHVALPSLNLTCADLALQFGCFGIKTLLNQELLAQLFIGLKADLMCKNEPKRSKTDFKTGLHLFWMRIWCFLRLI